MLTRLDLQNAGIGGIGADCLFQALIHNINLDDLNISHNEFGSHKLKMKYASLFLNTNETLTRLSLNNCNMNPHQIL